MSLSRQSSSSSLYILVAQLQLDDARQIENGQKRKGREGEQTSEEFAFSLYAALLEEDLRQMRDHRLAMSLERAGNVDGEALDEIMADEVRAQRDREWAVRLSRSGTPASTRPGSGANSGWQSPEPFRQNGPVFSPSGASTTRAQSSCQFKNTEV